MKAARGGRVQNRHQGERGEKSVIGGSRNIFNVVAHEEECTEMKGKFLHGDEK